MVGLPAVTPSTVPEVPTAASDGELLDHVPPAVELLNEIVEPSHTVLDVPAIAAGEALTVIVFEAEHPDDVTV